MFWQHLTDGVQLRHELRQFRALLHLFCPHTYLHIINYPVRQPDTNHLDSLTSFSCKRQKTAKRWVVHGLWWWVAGQPGLFAFGVTTRWAALWPMSQRTSLSNECRNTPSIVILDWFGDFSLSLLCHCAYAVGCWASRMQAIPARALCQMEALEDKNRKKNINKIERRDERLKNRVNQKYTARD